jgi:exopolysaccharide biosynthesis protein
MKIKINTKKILAFLVFETVFIGVTSPLLVFYGPYNTLRKVIVGTAMSSYSHQYIATIFLSENRIENILRGNASVETVAKPLVSTVQNLQEVTIDKTQDDTIEMYDIKGKRAYGYLLVVKNPSRVRVGYTSKLGLEGERTSDMAKQHSAVAAINGGAFNDSSDDGKIWCGTGAFPGGFLIVDGKLEYPEKFNGDERLPDAMGITQDGKLVVGPNSINDLKKKNVRDALVFGPTLIMNGKSQDIYDDQGITARTAIGQRKSGEILLLVMDGRQAKSAGSSLIEIQKIMMDQGAYNAINLDGGSSTTMYYDGEVINNPCNALGERTIATCIYVK